MSQSPIDPMTPVRALIEAAEEQNGCNPDHYSHLVGLKYKTADRAVAATASISQLLSEHDKVVEYIKELRESARMRALRSLGPVYEATDKGIAEGEKSCAGRLQSIQEGK